jgi:hypothetical protein
MPGSIMWRVIGPSVALGGMAAIILAMTAAIITVGVTGQTQVEAPQLSSRGMRPLLREMDFRLGDYQQLRKPFFGETRDRPRRGCCQ